MSFVCYKYNILTIFPIYSLQYLEKCIKNSVSSSVVRLFMVPTVPRINSTPARIIELKIHLSMGLCLNILRNAIYNIYTEPEVQ